jgi:hypothetical protein
MPVAGLDEVVEGGGVAAAGRGATATKITQLKIANA